MFAHILAVLLGFSSFTFYMAAFFYPEVHRRSDIWVSGLGLIYALVLWFFAGQMTAAVLLSQLLSVTLLSVLGWQVLSIRREKTPVYQQTPVTLTPEVVGAWAKNTVNQLRIAPEDSVRPVRSQNPSLNGTSADRFRQPMDPRRRPVYDYEFVEDGILADAPQEPVSEEAIADVLEAVSDVIPPSAEAEVIAAILPEKDADRASDADSSVELETVDSDFDTTAEVTDSGVTDLDAVEPDVTEPDVTELEAAELEVPEDVISTAESAVSDETHVADDAPTDGTSSDENELTGDGIDGAIAPDADWGLDDAEDDWMNDVTRSDDPSQHSQATPSTRDRSLADKPSLFAMPLILAGWVKDVVVSFSRPKPSKPVIEIPRREPNRDPANEPTGNRSNPRPYNSRESEQDSDFERDPQPAEAPLDDPLKVPVESPVVATEAPPAAETNDDYFDDDNSWAESNWND
ncbi:MAG: Ycf66 family protein [Cyanobacteria bacterium J06598_1]